MVQGGRRLFLGRTDYQLAILIKVVDRLNVDLIA